MTMRYRPHRTSRRAAPLLLGGLLLALGCDSDSDKKPGGGGDSDGDMAADGDNGGDGSSTDGDNGGDGNSSDGDDGGEDAGNCGTSGIEAEPKKVNVLVVLDRSKSMKPDTGADKWTPTTSAVGTALAAVQDKIAFGLDLFPTASAPNGDLGCEMPAEDAPLTVAVAPGTTSVPQIVDALGDTDNSPFGGTPTAAALARALRYYTEGAGMSLEGDRYVLLATDGGPNCNAALTCAADSCIINMEEGACERFMCCDSNCCAGQGNLNCLDDDTTLAQVQALKAAGISTFVIGIPGTEAFAAQLNAFAEAGGVPSTTTGATKYFAVDDPAALTDVLGSITRSLVKSCDLQLESTPPDPMKVNVQIEGETIPQAGADGWELDQSTSPPTLRIKGASCTRIETEGVESVEVIYGCPTVIVI